MNTIIASSMAKNGGMMLRVESPTFPHVGRRTFLRAVGVAGIGLLLPPKVDGTAARYTMLTQQSRKDVASQGKSPPTTLNPLWQSEIELNKANTEKARQETENAKFDTSLKREQIQDLQNEDSGLDTVVKGIGNVAPAAAFITAAGTIAFGIDQARRERERQRQERDIERKRQDDATFLSIATHLADDSPKARLLGATELLGFSRSEYKAYHLRVYDFTVGLLRERQVSESRTDPNMPDPFERAIIAAFVNTLPTVREDEASSIVDASGIHLDGASLPGVNLVGLSLKGATFRSADLRAAQIIDSDLEGVQFGTAILDDANLVRTICRRADLEKASIRGAKFIDVDFTKASIYDPNQWHLVEGAEFHNPKGLESLTVDLLRQSEAKVLLETE